MARRVSGVCVSIDQLGLPLSHGNPQPGRRGDLKSQLESAALTPVVPTISAKSRADAPFRWRAAVFLPIQLGSLTPANRPIVAPPGVPMGVPISAGLLRQPVK